MENITFHLRWMYTPPTLRSNVFLGILCLTHVARLTRAPHDGLLASEFTRGVPLIGCLGTGQEKKHQPPSGGAAGQPEERAWLVSQTARGGRCSWKEQDVSEACFCSIWSRGQDAQGHLERLAAWLGYRPAVFVQRKRITNRLLSEM